VLYRKGDTMRYVVVSLFVLVSFLFSDMTAFAAQAADVLNKPVEQCVKSGKLLPTVKTKDNCIKNGGAWMKMEAPEYTAPLGKSKAMPPDDFGKSKARPPDPLEKRKAMPPAGQITSPGAQ